MSLATLIFLTWGTTLAWLLARAMRDTDRLQRDIAALISERDTLRREALRMRIYAATPSHQRNGDHA